MKNSQVAWIASLAAFVCTAMIGQAEMLGEPWRHYVTIVSVIATALSGFMVQHPWNGKDDRRLAESPAYFVVQNGVANQVTRDGFESALRGAAEQLPQPLGPVSEEGR